MQEMMRLTLALQAPVVHWDRTVWRAENYDTWSSCTNPGGMEGWVGRAVCRGLIAVLGSLFAHRGCAYPNSAFHPSGVGTWGSAHGWAGKTVRTVIDECRTCVLLQEGEFFFYQKCYITLWRFYPFTSFRLHRIHEMFTVSVCLSVCHTA